MKPSASFPLVATAFLSFLSCVCSASTFVSGNVSGTWTTVGSPYVATGNLVVAGGATLTLQPGVTLIMGQGLNMDVEGTIAAIGTADKPITIRGANSSLYWDKIYLNYRGTQSSFIHCKISDATNALYLVVDGGVAGSASMTTPILNCVFTNCAGSCIYGYSHGFAGWQGGQGGDWHAYYPILNLQIQNCRFGASGNGCVFLADGSKASPTGSPSFYGNGAVSPQIVNCNFGSISGKAIDFYAGTYAATSYPDIENNVFVQCATAVQKSSLTLLNDVTAYNCFFNNSTNFSGYPVGVYGTICCVNNQGTSCDIANNIFSNPLFAESTAFTLATNSPCIDAGNPGTKYLDTCFPPSQGTTANDLGIYGGPGACGWVVVSVLSAIPNTNINEGVAWQYTPTVTGSGYTFGLSNAPAGMTIGASSGTISWTPTEAQGPGVYTNITCVVYQSGSVLASASFSVIVNELNAAPVLYVPGDQAATVGSILTVTNMAADGDVPSNPLDYGLVSGPAGVVLNPETGVLSWTPGLGQLGTNTITVSVTDYNQSAINNQRLSTTNSFMVLVKELNTSPVLYVPEAQTVYATTTLLVTNFASDSDIPANQLTFAVVSAPAGVALDSNTGVLRWTPSTSQLGTNAIAISVTDYNPWAVTQHISVTNTFTVIVRGLTAPSFLQAPASQVVRLGQEATFVSLATGYPFPDYQWQFSSNGVDYANINGATGANYQLASSAIADIGFYRVVISNSQKTITSSGVSLGILDLNMLAGVYLTAPVGSAYRIDAAPRLAPTNWIALTNITIPSSPYIYIDYSSATNRMQFYRAVPLP